MLRLQSVSRSRVALVRNTRIRLLTTPANPPTPSNKAPAPKKDDKTSTITNKDGSKAVGMPRVTRKPTVAEEIKYTKKRDLKLLAAAIAALITAKLAYDYYCNTLQIALYNDPNVHEAIWKQVGEDVWLEGATTRLVVRRYGRDLSVSGEPRVVKRRQIRYWNTFEYIAEALMFMFRFRTRIFEDIGTVEIAIPVKGSKREGTYRVRAYTRDNNWILDKAWLEDEEMVIELKRRIQLDFLLNPEPDLLIELEKNRK